MSATDSAPPNCIYRNGCAHHERCKAGGYCEIRQTLDPQTDSAPAPDTLIERLHAWCKDAIGDPLSQEMFDLKEAAATALAAREQETRVLRQTLWCAAHSQPNATLRISSLSMVLVGPKSAIERYDDPATGDVVIRALPQLQTSGESDATR